MVDPEIQKYNEAQVPALAAVCKFLSAEIERGLPEAVGRIWHGHPVWFLHDNPIVGYSKQKPGIRLMFWSGAGFDEPALDVVGKKFKDASRFLQAPADVRASDLKRWLAKSKRIQWDYANIAKRKGRLARLR